MRGLVWRAIILLTSITSLAGTAAPTRTLTYEDRVRAQEAIERVYYSHLVGETRSFDDAVTPALIENKVRTYLQQSAALKELWGVEITPTALRRELERIAGATRMPGRLLEIYDALHNDPLLVEECFARPSLVDRLARSAFASDEDIHRSAREEAEALRDRLVSGEIEPSLPNLTRIEIEVVAKPSPTSPEAVPHPPCIERLELDHEAFAHWRALLPATVGEVGSVIEEPERLIISVLLSEKLGDARVAHYVVPKLGWDEWWESTRERWQAETLAPVERDAAPPVLPNPGSRATASPGSDPGTASLASCTLHMEWANGILDDLPRARVRHTAIWTGSLMIVWGGYNQDFGALNSGVRYDPVTDTWSPVSTINAPIARYSHVSVWTGSVMLVWGGIGKLPRGQVLRSGGRYDPATDTWKRITTDNAPSARFDHTAVWTGREMVIWGGGNDSYYFGTGGRYDPVRNRWKGVSKTHAPSPRFGHTAVWTGTRMIVWGGQGWGPLNSGGGYDPATNSWTSVTDVGAPSARYEHTAVWSGAEMIVWGGGTGSPDFVATGGRYDPVANSWKSVEPGGAPAARGEHLAVWTGTEMIVHGGHAGSGAIGFNDGAKYDPATDSWTYLSNLGAPSKRYLPTGVWTDSLFIVWGGTGLNTGARYDPSTDTWTPTLALNAPSARVDHSAYWTGTVMLVWGGYGYYGQTNTGGRYDPLLDAWFPMTMSAAPEPRLGSPLWTGSYLIVWGGEKYATSGIYINTGGFYDPIADVWRPTSLTDAPSPRVRHAMVWTGHELIVWGGALSTFKFLNTGGRYDPDTDTWSDTSLMGAPSARQNATAFWTGSEMILWGGEETLYHHTASGGRYDPTTNLWQPIATVNAPSARGEGTAVWTGQELLVWGGMSNDGHTEFNDGGRYDPAADMWRPMSIMGAPAPRSDHTTIWTGDDMLVWGGYSPATGTAALRSGGRYDSVSDVWKPISVTGAPNAYFEDTAIWTGSRMILWGGMVRTGLGSTYAATGGAYDPAADLWQATPLAGAPSPRARHTAVWTGQDMIVFGGGGPTYDNGGGRLSATVVCTSAQDSVAVEGAAAAPDGH